MKLFLCLSSLLYQNEKLSRRQPRDVSDDSRIRNGEIASKFAPCETYWRICILPTWCIYLLCSGTETGSYKQVQSGADPGFSQGGSLTSRWLLMLMTARMLTINNNKNNKYNKSIRVPVSVLTTRFFFKQEAVRGFQACRSTSALAPALYWFPEA